MPTSSSTTYQPIGRHPCCAWMVLIFRMFGIWHTADSSLAYRVYAAVLHLICTFLYTVTLCAGVWAQRTVTERITASGMTLTLIALNVKLANLYAHMRGVQRVLGASERFEVSAPVELQAVRGGQRRFACVLCAYYAMANAAGVTAYLSAWHARQLPFAARYAPLVATSETDGRVVGAVCRRVRIPGGRHGDAECVEYYDGVVSQLFDAFAGDAVGRGRWANGGVGLGRVGWWSASVADELQTWND